jgi:hypothetical protein
LIFDSFRLAGLLSEKRAAGNSAAKRTFFMAHPAGEENVAG